MKIEIVQSETMFALHLLWLHLKGPFIILQPRLVFLIKIFNHNYNCYFFYTNALRGPSWSTSHKAYPLLVCRTALATSTASVHH